MADALKDKKALITGSGRGIGRAIAVELAARGMSIVLVSRSADQLKESAEMVRRHGVAATEMVVDLADQVQLKELITRVYESNVDVLVNNAGTVAPVGPTVTNDFDEWVDNLKLNLISAALLTKELLPSMLAAGWGRVVNISTGLAGRPHELIGGNAYTTSKAALEAYTLNLAAELEASGVTINVYRPGMVDTAMQEWLRTRNPERVGQSLHERFSNAYQQGKLRSADEAAHSLVERMGGNQNGQIWSITDVI